MSYSDQTSGENLSRGHYQTVPRDFKPLILPSTPQVKRKESILKGVAMLMLVKRIAMDFIDEQYSHLKQRNKR